MATKTISITEEAYERLKTRKAKNESFTDVINRVTGKRSLLELAGILSDEEADEFTEWFSKLEVMPNIEIIKEASKFRLNNKNKNFSYADCIGYIYALRSGLKFLTGDQQFESTPNVEFVR